ncbi:MAG: DNA-formamidopyrimidine glycosylase family protein [Saprospiraceae bacterium]
MPELPEVNTFQRYFDRTALQQRIALVQVHDAKIIRNMSGELFAEKLQNRLFTGSYRQGKYLFGTLDNGHAVLLHFGMTGDLNYYMDDADRTKFERFAFVFDNGFRLGFDDPRKFADVRYLDDREAYLQSIKLGKDALLLTENEFLQLLAGKKGNLKAFFLNQHYLAGVGNLYADEICYQAQVHPASRVENLPPEVQRLLYQKMQEIFRFAVENEAYYKNYPANWFWRWRAETEAAPDGSKPTRLTLAGRTTYCCEGWQKLY